MASWIILSVNAHESLPESQPLVRACVEVTDDPDTWRIDAVYRRDLDAESRASVISNYVRASIAERAAAAAAAAELAVQVGQQGTV